MKATSFRPGELWPDTAGAHVNAHGGGILYHDGAYYWFGEHKIAGDAGNRAHVGVGVYRSADLYNWENLGVALAVHDDPASDITRECVLERPKVIYNPRTKQFVMWFHLELKGQGYKAARTGLAVSDSVAGPYTFVRSLRPNAGQWPLNMPRPAETPAFNEEDPDRWFHRDFPGGQMARDMSLFVDDDGSAYHLHASEENATLHISKLTDDYLDFTGEYVRLFRGRFHEAPAMFKRGGKYYLFSSDCTGWAPNPARLSTADQVLGEWTELGNPCVGEPEKIATTFESQSTHVLKVEGQDAYIFMADRWRPKDAIDGRYIWLPIEFDPTGKPELRWRDEWTLDHFATA
ncbi:MAG: glycoside hydrolase family 43 protein [Tepidisphaeraceae bacterium]